LPSPCQHLALETEMKRYPSLRPSLYARMVRDLIAAARAGRSSTELRADVLRITAATGVSASIVMSDLVQAGLDILSSLPLS
jgi:hypothetical protein